jgi:hypothetical protein
MYRITRGSHIQHAPAFPSPTLRFPNGTTLPIYAEEEDTEHSAPGARRESEASNDVSPPPKGVVIPGGGYFS